MSESKKGLKILRPIFQKLRKGSSSSSCNASPSHEDTSVSKAVPGDVKQGYFTVFAVNGQETQRFVIEVDHLTNPEFQRLLDQAREEYGFQQKGVLSLPCRPDELQEIINHSKEALLELKVGMKEIEGVMAGVLAAVLLYSIL